MRQSADVAGWILEEILEYFAEPFGKNMIQNCPKILTMLIIEFD